MESIDKRGIIRNKSTKDCQNSSSMLEIRIVEESPGATYYDFFIDGKYLPHLLQIGQRRDNWSFYGCDLDYFEVDRIRFPKYDRTKIIKNFVNVCLDKKRPFNQFGTERVVLYRCHCGCDYCGVISFSLKTDDEFVHWMDIRYETEGGFEDYEPEDDDEYDMRNLKTGDLKFCRAQYEYVFNEYLGKIASLK